MKIIEFSTKQTENPVHFMETGFPDSNVQEWKGMTVFGEFLPDGSLHPMTLRLLAKAREMAGDQNDKAQILLIGDGLTESGKQYFSNGADRIFIYDDPSLANAGPLSYTGILAHFIDNFKPAAMLFAGTPLGRILIANILEYARSVVDEIKDSEGQTELPPVILNSDQKGELVICEIPA